MSKTKMMLLLVCLTASQLHAQIITTFAGNGVCGYSGDYLLATAAKISVPMSIAKDIAGNLYFSEKGNHVIRKVSPAGIITKYAGTGVAGFSGDGGPATAADIQVPAGICTDKNGNLFFTGAGARVRKIDPSGIITTFAGNGSATISGDGGPATAAGIGSITSLCVDTAGNILIAGSYRIKKIDASGIITTIAGTGLLGFTGDGGPATAAQFTYINQIITDKENNIYFTDEQNHRIRKIDGNGIITTVAGSGAGMYAGDGLPANTAKLAQPQGIWKDSCGNIYIADGTAYAVRIVNTAGNIYTIAGTGVNGHSGDGGPATAAQLTEIYNIYLDNANNLYLAMPTNCRIRKIALPRCDSLVFPSAVGDVGTNEPGLSIWPNPATNQLQLQLNITGTPAHVAIVTLTGTTVQQMLLPPGKPTTVPLHLPTGMYLVVADTEQGRMVKKLMVE
ncbi:MAG: T9SS type A sorting domain-containing protein [Flavipsychrobacter sp.]|nr:T9SS type A sorting domain-containing protein [Flavipsychrobacter sp.]